MSTKSTEENDQHDAGTPRKHTPNTGKAPQAARTFYLWPEGRNPRVGNPFRGHPGQRDLLGASEWPTFFSRSVENERTSPRPLKSLSEASEGPSRALRAPGRGFPRPRIAETRGRIPTPKGPQNLWTPPLRSAPRAAVELFWYFEAIFRCFGGVFLGCTRRGSYSAKGRISAF